MRVLVRPVLAREPAARFADGPTVVGPVGFAIALAEARVAVRPVVVALLDVARLVALAVALPRVVAPGEAPVERKLVERVV